MKPGEIVLVKFPFTSLDSEKKRPALVLLVTSATSKINFCTVAMITSKIEGLKFSGDIALSDWKLAGLLHPSLLRLSKTATIDQELITKKLGSLSSKDKNIVKKEFSSLWKNWI
jgi:mRNA interferase MazF